MRCTSIRLTASLGGLTFSFFRAIQQPAEAIWRGEAARVPQVQQALLHRAKCNSEAGRGVYDVTMEQAGGRASGDY